jgi:hypothetical protein
MTAISLIPKSTTTITTQTSVGQGQIVFQHGTKTVSWIRGTIRGEDFETEKKEIPAFLLRHWNLARPMLIPFIGKALERIGATKQHSPNGVVVVVRVETAANVREEQFNVSVDDGGIKIVENLLAAMLGVHSRFGK